MNTKKEKEYLDLPMPSIEEARELTKHIVKLHANMCLVIAPIIPKGTKLKSITLLDGQRDFAQRNLYNQGVLLVKLPENLKDTNVLKGMEEGTYVKSETLVAMVAERITTDKYDISIAVINVMGIFATIDSPKYHIDINNYNAKAE